MLIVNNAYMEDPYSSMHPTNHLLESYRHYDHQQTGPAVYETAKLVGLCLLILKTLVTLVTYSIHNHGINHNLVQHTTQDPLAIYQS